MKADDGHDELMARAKVIEDMMTDVFEVVPDLKTQIRVGRRFIEGPEAYPPLSKPVPPMPDPPKPHVVSPSTSVSLNTTASASRKFVEAEAPSENQLWIHGAIYGYGSHERDVSHVLRGLVKNGRLRVLVNNRNMGGDPCRGKRKALFVEYRTLYGTQGLLSVEAKEGTYLELPSLRAKAVTHGRNT
jgi:hypothetical protein